MESLGVFESRAGAHQPTADPKTLATAGDYCLGFGVRQVAVGATYKPESSISEVASKVVSEVSLGDVSINSKASGPKPYKPLTNQAPNP